MGGKNCCAGLLSGALVSSVQLAISMSNSGGAWDNAKKYISSGGLGNQYKKGSEAQLRSTQMPMVALSGLERITLACSADVGIPNIAKFCDEHMFAYPSIHRRQISRAWGP